MGFLAEKLALTCFVYLAFLNDACFIFGLWPVRD